MLIALRRDEGCDGWVAEALVCKFNIVGFAGLWVREASSFNNRVTRGTSFTGVGSMAGLF